MAFLEILQEALTRDQVADLVRYVAIVSIEREREGNSRRYLNVHYAKKGEVDWAEMTSPGIFIMKGKFLKDIYPNVKGKLGPVKFVDRDAIRDKMEYGKASAIPTDVETRMTQTERPGAE